MKKSLQVSLVGLLAFGIAGSAAAQLKPEEMMQFRQASMKTMGWNMGKIKVQAEGPADKFDKVRVEKAAKAVQAIANSGYGELFAAGTDKSIGDVKTRVKPELFDPKNKEELTKLAKNFNEQANKLAEVAGGGDAAAIKAQFGETGKACKACHEKFREEDKKK